MGEATGMESERQSKCLVSLHMDTKDQLDSSTVNDHSASMPRVTPRLRRSGSSQKDCMAGQETMGRS